ncbi:MAG: Homoprotocatechuate catabolism bifunctional isomerase/decarboxylase [Burkholderiaceae bacterium]|nr:Homoprotocatechuate catabolism bifunctional isomerase/decarboxylase [Burkholderiaceae bacterium]
MSAARPGISAFDFAPFALSGTVVGVLLNHAPALAALGDAVNAAPYKAPPKAPVLYVKPRNTLAGAGSACQVPAGVEALQVGANLGIVIGRAACRVPAADAESFVAGYVIVDDLSVPHDSFYRPSVRFKALDGSCVVGPVVPRARVRDAGALGVRVFVDGELVQSADTGSRVRTLARLLADITDFMTLAAGDIVLLGTAHGAPSARAGQRIAIEIDGLGRLEHTLAGAAQRPAEPHA